MPERGGWGRGGEDFQVSTDNEPQLPSRRNFLKLSAAAAIGLGLESVLPESARAQDRSKRAREAEQNSLESAERERAFAVKVSGLSPERSGDIAAQLQLALQDAAKQKNLLLRGPLPEFEVSFNRVEITQKQSRLRQAVAREGEMEVEHIPVPQPGNNSTTAGRLLNVGLSGLGRTIKRKTEKHIEEKLAPVEGKAALQYVIRVGTETTAATAVLHYERVDDRIEPKEFEPVAGVLVHLSDPAFQDRGDVLKQYIAEQTVALSLGRDHTPIQQACERFVAKNSR